MPQIWERIEARQTFSFFLGRMTRGFVTAAAALTLVMAGFLYLPQHTGPFWTESYVESLAASHSGDSDLPETASLDASETAGRL